MWRNLYEALQKLQRFVIRKYLMNMMKRQDYCVSVLDRNDLPFEYISPFEKEINPYYPAEYHVDIFQYPP